jgi:hypothetical protein
LRRSSGKPIYVLDPFACRRRYAVFHSRLLQEGRTRAWPADGVLEPATLWRRRIEHLHANCELERSTLWTATDELSDTERAAARVAELLRERGVLV